MSLIDIKNLTHAFGDNLLYKNAALSLNKGEHLGIVGPNGTGKSTLLKICTAQIISDAGEILWQPKITVGYLGQYAEIDKSLTMEAFLKSAFSELYQLEQRMTLLYEQAARGDTTSLHLASQYQEQLEIHGFYTVDTQVEQVVTGLGLTAMGLKRPIGEMSGGQRAKVKMCLLTLRPCNFLIMDEPTNHLDLLAKEALKEALIEFPGTVLLVSHEKSFYRDWTHKVINMEKR